MTDNEILARWQGLDSHECDEHAFHCDDCVRGSMQTPDYLTNSAACMSLLDTLVKKGYYPEVFYCSAHNWNCAIQDDDLAVQGRDKDINTAIVAAVLEVAKKEQVE